MVQKALQSLEALCADESLEERLTTCRLLMTTVNSGQYYAPAPAAVRKAFHEYERSEDEGVTPEEEAVLLRALLVAIFQAWGNTPDLSLPPEDE